MSYYDDFAILWKHVTNADGITSALKLSAVLVEIPHDWFLEHGLEPFGRQATDQKTWLLSEREIFDLWKESEPKVRWKEVYG